MASPGEKALQSAITTCVFDPVYYFHGDDDFLKESSTRKLVKVALDDSMRDFNLETRRASELDTEDLDALLGTPPMLAERRVVILRDVDKLKKGARAFLDRYLARPASDTILVLASPAGVKSDKALAERATVVEFAPLSTDRLPKWIAHHAKTELAREITPEAAALLIRAVGSDLPQLAVELEKLASYASETIDEHAVTEVVGIRRGETITDLLDAIAAKDAATALPLIPIVLQQPKSTAVWIVMMLSVQMLGIAYGQAALAAGVAPRSLFSELMSLLKETGAFPGRPWGEAVGVWTKQAPHWSASELDDALSAMLAADAALKETRISSSEQLLTTLVLALCGGAARRAA